MKTPEIHPKFDHLEKGFKPIVVAIENMVIDKEKILKERAPFNYAENVDYSTPYYRNSEMLNGGFQTWVISTINSHDKYSFGLMDCTGLVIVGEDKKTGKNISLLSHQDPKKFLQPNFIELFKSQISAKIKKLIDQSKKGSIDVLIVGGKNMDKDNTMEKDDYQTYKDSVQLLSDICSRFGLKASVALGPKEHMGGESHIYFDNTNRRLYVYMPKHSKDPVYEDFEAKDVDSQIEKIINSPETRLL